MAPQILYLHGFASSPQSRKATYIGDQLRRAGRSVAVPDLDANDFEHSTVTKQLQVVEDAIGGRETVLIGSSMGGYLASLAAGRNSKVQKLVLLAPAFGFAQLWAESLGPERLSEWKQNGTINVFHYEAGRQLQLNWDFMEDAQMYPAFPSFKQPALIFHGDRDKVVPLERSERFAAEHANVKLTALPSGHELTDVLDRIWQDSKEFVLELSFENRC